MSSSPSLAGACRGLPTMRSSTVLAALSCTWKGTSGLPPMAIMMMLSNTFLALAIVRRVLNSSSKSSGSGSLPSGLPDCPGTHWVGSFFAASIKVRRASARSLRVISGSSLLDMWFETW